MAQRLQQAMDRIDALNAADPNTDTVHGVSRPRELAYAERLSTWVLRLNPQACETLRIAARGQHVRRWTMPRSQYTMNRQGYLKWRETLKAFHAETVAGLMREAGYEEAQISRVRSLMSKRELGRDADTQTLEDALCLVFLETQFAELRAKTPDEKMLGVLKKTWTKMSEAARAEALRLPLSEAERHLLQQALG